MALISTIWDEPVTALTTYGRLTHLDLEVDTLPGAFLEAADDDYTVGYVEDLKFATDGGYLDGLLEDGWLTQTAIDKATEVLRGYLKKAGVPGADSLASNDQAGGDEPNIEFSLAIPCDAAATVGRIINDVVLPFCGVLQNVTDPGTYNSPYLWADVKR